MWELQTYLAHYSNLCQITKCSQPNQLSLKEAAGLDRSYEEEAKAAPEV
jgi:hypothetical protein